MAERVLAIEIKDHVSPILQAIDAMRLTLPMNVSLPPLPADLLSVESVQRTFTVAVAMRPSPSMLDWLAAVRRLSTR